MANHQKNTDQIPAATSAPVARTSKLLGTIAGGMWKLLSLRLPLFVVLVLAAAAGVFYLMQSGGDEAAKVPDLQTTDQVVRQVSTHILLPSGEQPTVATVTDASKVRNQAFFSNAASGDKVLVYAQAKKAYLYRPSIDRIIEVAPLAPNQEGQEGL